MTLGLHAVTRTGAALAAVALWLVTLPAIAQSLSPPPPPPPPPPAAPAKADASRSAAPRSALQLTPAERAAIDAAAERKEKAATNDEALAPTASDMRPRTNPDINTTRIEQTRTSNRVSEVIVTPAGQTQSYVMYNREGRAPYGTTQMNSGLSVPMFFRFEFGKPAPATPPPPPPSPSPSR